MGVVSDVSAILFMMVLIANPEGIYEGQGAAVIKLDLCHCNA